MTLCDSAFGVILMDPQARRWCFTLNNDTDEERVTLATWKCKAIVAQGEIGENGTHHIQGCIWFKTGIRFSTLHRKLERAHWEKCRDWEASIEYCRKEETWDGEFRLQKGVARKIIDRWDPARAAAWQLDLLEIISAEPDPRKIYWWWEPTGAVGKTTLAKHICLNDDSAIYVSGKAADIKCAVAGRVEEGLDTRTIIFDLARSQEGFVSYQAIEEVKNGIFFSGKYESKMVMFEIPHVIVFANFGPEEYKLSVDRWELRVLNSPLRAL